MKDDCCTPTASTVRLTPQGASVMASASLPRRAFFTSVTEVARRVDRLVLAMVIGTMALAIFSPRQAATTLQFLWSSFGSTAPWLVASALLAAAAKATGSESLIASAFSAHEGKAVIYAAALGSLSAFCSCGVIPIIAGMMVAGVPLGPIMAFWLSSPLMDPELFVLISATLGLGFAVAKTLAAIGIGIFGGYTAMALSRAGALKDTLRVAPASSCCDSGETGSATVTTRPPVWRFWEEPERAQTFVAETGKALWLVARWIAAAYLLESVLIAYVPHEAIARYVGGPAVAAVPVAVGLGTLAYVNPYAALPLVKGLIGLGMSPPAALAFMISGAGSNIPSVVAVWGLVKLRLFLLYVVLGLLGALLTGYLYALALSLVWAIAA